MQTLIFSSTKLEAAYKDLPNKDLLYIAYDKKIPSVNRGIKISVSFDENGKVRVEDSSRQIPDPSTIYIHLPIADGDAMPLDYWPHYIEMSPQQRCCYLTWLRDVTQPIDMGYVFIYYYGLERQMLTGNFDRAFDEIIKLRNAHYNRSFQKYSENALVHAALMNGKIDKLIDLHDKTEISGYNNAMFLLAHNQKLTLGEKQLMLIFKKAFPLSKSAEKENKTLYEECIAETLSNQYSAGFPLSSYDLSKVAIATERRFANYSFPPEINAVDITDFYKCKVLIADLKVIFNDAYSLYKLKNKLLKSGQTTEEVTLSLHKKKLSRYQKLLKSKLITKDEHDTLVSAIVEIEKRRTDLA
ncbi:MAG: TerB N-terminal domain-containing protein [Bacteroidales bacterium]